MSRIAHAPLVILGAGYTGRFIYHAARQHRRQVFATSRTPKAHLSFAEPDHRIFFDLQQPETWTQIPPQSDIIWCFPALPQDVAGAFAQHAIDRESRLLLLGSTSAFPGRPARTRRRTRTGQALHAPRVPAKNICEPRSGRRF